MILTKEEIIGRIKNPTNNLLIKRAREIYKQHLLHIKGVGVDEFISKVQNYENEEQLNNRKKTTKPMTVPIFGKELSTFDKIFSAQGFSRYFNIGTESSNKEAEFKKYLNSDIGEGRSLSEWMNEVWLDKVNTDPNSVFFVELPEKWDDETSPYLTHKCIVDIHDFEKEGKGYKYIIFVETKQDKDGVYKEYRVVDDAFDYIVIEREWNIKIIDELTIPNSFGFVPAIGLSTQKDNQSDANTSYVWKALSVADEYLTDSSIHSVLKKLHGYPIFWMRERGCRSCQGEGKIIGTEPGQFITCSDCKGSGFTLKKDVSDGIVIPQLTQQGQVDSLPVAGYEQPDLATLAEQRTELDWLKNQIHIAIWSSDEVVSGQQKTEDTATGRMLEVQAIYDKLNIFSKNAELVEKFICDTLGGILYSDYNGSVINYGRRYFVRSAYEIEQLYQEAKKAELPVSILSAYREELVYVKFGNDPIQLSRQLKLMELEPFLDYTIEQIKDMGVSQDDIFMKIYFNEYISKYERDYKPITTSTIEEIEGKISQYNKEKVNANKATELTKTSTQPATA